MAAVTSASAPSADPAGLLPDGLVLTGMAWGGRDVGLFHFGFRHSSLFGYAGCGMMHHAEPEGIKRLAESAYAHLRGCSGCCAGPSPSKSEIRAFLDPAFAEWQATLEEQREGQPVRVGVLFPDEFLKSWQPFQRLLENGELKVLKDGSVRVCSACLCLNIPGKACCAATPDFRLEGLTLHRRPSGQGVPFISAPRDKLLLFLADRAAWLKLRQDETARALLRASNNSSIFQRTSGNSSMLRTDSPPHPPPLAPGPIAPSSSSLAAGAFRTPIASAATTTTTTTAGAGVGMSAPGSLAMTIEPRSLFPTATTAASGETLYYTMNANGTSVQMMGQQQAEPFLSKAQVQAECVGPRKFIVNGEVVVVPRDGGWSQRLCLPSMLPTFDPGIALAIPPAMGVPNAGGWTVMNKRLMGCFFPDQNALPSPDFKLRLAGLNTRLDKGNAEDYCFIRACEIFFEQATFGASKLLPHQIKRINDLLYGAPSTATRAADPAVILASGHTVFVTSTYERATTLKLALLVKLVTKVDGAAEVPGRELLYDALQQTLAQALHESDFKSWDLLGLVKAICIFLYALAGNPVSLITRTLRLALFQRRRQHVSELSSGNDGDDSDDEGGYADGNEEETLLQSAAGTSMSLDSVVMRSPTMMKSIAQALNRSLKCVVLFGYTQFVEASGPPLRAASDLAESDAESGAQQVKRTAMFVDPDEQLAETFGNSMTMVSLAQIIHSLKTLENNYPSLVNACVLGTGSLEEPVISFQSERFDASRILRAGQHLLRKCENEFLSSFFGQDMGPGNEDVAAILAAVWDPASRELAVVSVDPGVNKHCPKLDLTTSVARRLASFAKDLRGADPDVYRQGVDALRSSLVANIYFFGGAVLRAPELAGFQLATETTDGNLFLGQTMFQSATLLFADLISKNDQQCIALLPPPLSRMVLVLLLIHGPELAEAMVQDLVSRIETGSTSVNNATRAILRNLWRSWLTTSLSTTAEFSPTFAKRVREAAKNREQHDALLSELETNPAAATLRVYLPDDARTIVTAQVSKSSLRSVMNFAALRHFFDIWKVHLLEFLEDDAKRSPPTAFAASQLASLRLSTAKNSRDAERIQGLALAGGHSPRTSARTYQTQLIIGSIDDNTSVPGIKFESTRLMQAGIELFFGWPQQEYDLAIAEGAPAIRNGPKKTPIFSPIDEDQSPEAILESWLASKGMPNWLCTQQRDAAVAILTTRDDILLFLPCGFGKTVCYLAPLAQASYGFSVVVVPYVALMESQMAYGNSVLGLHCVAFDKTSPLFAPNAFVDPQSRAQDTPRFVFVVTETAVQPRTLEYLRAAASHGLLNNIVVDETHQVLLSQDYRASLERIRLLKTLNVRLVLASGTVPRCFLPAVVDFFCLQPHRFREFRRDDAYGQRLIVSPVRLETVRAGQLVTFAVNLIKNRFRDRPNERRSVLVLVMRDAEKDSIAAQFGGDTRFAVMTVNSKSSPAHRKAIFQRLRDVSGGQGNPERQCLVVATSVFGEGVDLADVGCVIVLGGTYCGGVTLHQMMNRAGRGGVVRVEPPHAFFIYAPLYIERDVFRSREELGNHEKAVMVPFAVCESGAIRNLVTKRSFEDFFTTENNLVCGGILMERMLDVQQLSPACGKCHRCAPQAFGSLLDTPTHGAEPPPGVSNAGGSVARPSIASSEEEATAKLLNQYGKSISFLQAAGKRCVSCNEPNCQRYPNRCSATLRLFNQRTMCMSCFNSGHKFTSFESVVRLAGETPDEFRQRKNREYDSEVSARCATVVVGCDAYGIFQPCHKCMLSHQDVNSRTELRKECFCSDPHLVRHVAIIVWNTSLVWEFLSELNVPLQRQQSMTWTEYFRMVVYQGQATVQNAFLLIEFFMRNLARWRSSKLTSRFNV